MKWTYSQSSGVVSHGDFCATGYSGFGEGRNNGALEMVPSVGPIPLGLYRIGPAYTDQHLGPFVMHLDPIGHEAHKRTLFRIHGDNETHDASHGCVILDHATRVKIDATPERLLEVVP